MFCVEIVSNVACQNEIVSNVGGPWIKLDACYSWQLPLYKLFWLKNWKSFKALHTIFRRCIRLQKIALFYSYTECVVKEVYCKISLSPVNCLGNFLIWKKKLFSCSPSFAAKSGGKYSFFVSSSVITLFIFNPVS
jgi:hypothetical protein